jgi:large subunit ribosomal protein L9
MKVYLLENIKKIGSKGEVKNVADGYAQNFLIPNKKALPATPEIVQQMKLKNAQTSAQQAHYEKSLQQLVTDIRGKTVEITAKMNDKGRLYKSLDVVSLAKILSQKLKKEIQPDFIQLTNPIKEGREHEIILKVFGVSGELKLIINSA